MRMTGRGGDGGQCSGEGGLEVDRTRLTSHFVMLLPPVIETDSQAPKPRRAWSLGSRRLVEIGTRESGAGIPYLTVLSL